MHSMLNDLHHDVLRELFHETGNGDFLTFYQLEIITGMDGVQLRGLLEDLKAGILVMEHPEGFQVSPEGISYCRSRWA